MSQGHESDPAAQKTPEEPKESGEKTDDEMREQIKQSLDELIEGVGIKTTRDLMWLFTDPKFQPSIKYYQSGDVVEFNNYKQD